MLSPTALLTVHPKSQIGASAPRAVASVLLKVIVQVFEVVSKLTDTPAGVFYENQL
ncbi:MAG: hypothetical protein HZC46_09605 [Ignavibacterium album]|uniref:hypothetical protein n=1 Tax=Ignavibacterium album TaxID=591197 RepID=UPI0026F06F14|nr:hypothetical protein [Ignavibacterium album]MBI5662388.1 hypothetical protein [Ignavibacterium album]